MCVKPAALTTHTPPKPFACPRTATRPSRALLLATAAPTHARRLRDAFPADLTTHSPPKLYTRPHTATRPRRALPIVHAAPTHARRLCDARPPTAQHLPRRRLLLAPAQRHALAEHFRSPTQPRRTPTQRRCTPADCAMHSPPPSPPILHRSPSLAPAQRHTLPEHFRSSTQRRRTPTQPRHTPAGCAMHSPPPHNTFPAEDFLSPPHSDTPVPSTSAPPRSADARPHSPDARPQAARCTPRSPHNPFPAAPRCLSFRSASGTKKRHRTVHVRCRMSRSTVVAVGHLGW